MEIFAEIFCISTGFLEKNSTNSFIGEGVVVVLPAELSFDVTARSQTLACFDDVQIGDLVEVDVTWSIEIFLCD